MIRLALTFIVGVFLFVAGGTGGAWAVTFKDGKVSKDNQIEEPVQKVERKSTGSFLGQLFGGKNQKASMCGPFSTTRIETTSPREVCIDATTIDKSGIRKWSSLRGFVKEAKKRRLTCGVGNENTIAMEIIEMETNPRGLNCSVDNTKQIISSSADNVTSGAEDQYRSEPIVQSEEQFSTVSDNTICYRYTSNSSTGSIIWNNLTPDARKEISRRGLTCGVRKAVSRQTASTDEFLFVVSNKVDIISLQPNGFICSIAVVGNRHIGKNWRTTSHTKYVQEAKRRGLTCGVEGFGSTQIAIPSTTTPAPKPNSAELIASQRKTEQLEAELAAIKAQQAEATNKITSDTQVPLLTILSSSSKGKQGILEGQARDNSGIAEVTVDGQQIAFDASGNFEFRTFIPATGKDVLVEVTDLAGLSNSKVVSLSRSGGLQSASISFDDLNPMGKKVSKNANALALIIGVDGYENTPARAIYADSDAQVFTDYASEKLGIPSNRIKTLVNDGAGEREMLLSVKSWLSRSVKQDKTDVYIFFAGHGLASDDGQKMYLLPYDGAPELLNDTAISRERLFSDISSANPRSVTVFLDTCYSGTTRGTDMLIASRPIGIRALEQSIPDNFTVMTAAAGDQTAKPLEEAKHGMFSYFLMKGMEGEADANNDNQITAGELHAYVEQNVVQQSSGSQTPELQGDASRVLVRFQ